jgi:N-acetylglucosamine-6-phosphate deacetylase
MQEALINAEIFDGDALHQGKALLIDDGRVLSIVDEAALASTTPRVDMQGQLLVPGLVDLQVNGGGGVLFNSDTSTAGLKRIAAAHIAAGTTSLLPTIISDSDAVMETAIAAVDAVTNTLPSVIGIHLEGPCLNPEKCGVHDAGIMRELDDDMLSLMSSLAQGKTLVTLAPECVPTERIAELVARGVIVSAGHSLANFDEAEAAIAAGLRGVTHLFNAMPPLLSRDPGLAGAALSDDRAWFGIIVDGYHMHPSVVKLALRGKNAGGAILVSDAMPSVGTEGETFELYGETIHVAQGRCVTDDGRLAGAHLTLLQAVHNAAEYAGLDWFEALRMASLYPAQAIGLSEEVGSLRPGCRADFLVLDNNKNLQQVWVEGKRWSDESF